MRRSTGSLLVLSLLFVFAAATSARAGTDPARVFEPGLISSADGEFFGIVFSPDGKEAFWSRRTIFVSRLQKGKWSEPAPISFSTTDYRDTKPVLTSDGQVMVFASNRPIEGLTPAHKAFVNLWMSRRSGEGWSAPEPLPAPINTEWDEDFPTLAADGTLYFASNRNGNPQAYTQYRSPRTKTTWGDPVAAPFPFQKENEALSWIAPDDSFALFTSMRDGGAGSADIYVAFRDRSGIWSDAINAGAAVNSSSVDWCARIAPDGRSLFFSSNRGATPDIYEVDASVIRALRPKK